MTTEDAFLQAIIDNPADHASLLIYADWLDDQGETGRAECIRLQYRLATTQQRHPRRGEWKAQQQKLRAAFGADWVQQFGVLMPWISALVLFRRRLAETMAWCRERTPGSLHTPALRPVSLFKPTRTERRWDWPPPWSGERHVLVNALANQRRQLLRRGGLPPEEREGEAPAEPGAGGRLLLFYPDDSSGRDPYEWWSDLMEDEDEPPTDDDGVLDVENVPAWDTWVSYAEDWHPPEKGWVPFSSYLVSWIPPGLVDRVSARMEENPRAKDCLRWARDVQTDLTRRLHTAGLLS
jgi:uncharacterized protein (TIGR02996 family)